MEPFNGQAVLNRREKRRWVGLITIRLASGKTRATPWGRLRKPFWSNVRSWWNLRRLPNVMMIHFNDMKRDLPGAVKRVASFLEIDLDPATFDKVVEHSSFDWMKKNAHLAAPLGGSIWEGGATTFINKGTNGRWQGTLTQEEICAYEQRAREELGTECAAWLADGEGPRH